MVNTDVRKLMLFEFNRALSYVSEILEIKEEIKKMENLKTSLNCEISDWQNEKDSSEEIVLQEIVNELKRKYQDAESEILKLKTYKVTLHELIEKIMEAIIEDKELSLVENEIRQDMLKEYVYILCEIILVDVIDGDIRNIFDDISDLIILLCKEYGEDKPNLVKDIINDELEDFDYYFK